MPELKLAGTRAETGKHVFTLGKSGLPDQIVIKADEPELPLELRGKQVDSHAVLAGLGRGEILREPIRIEVRTEAGAQATEVSRDARPSLKRGNVTCECSECEHCGSFDVYGFHEEGCPVLEGEPSDEDFVESYSCPPWC